MEIIAKVSRGSKMDQVYIPKQRSGLSVGSHVVISELELQKDSDDLYYYNIRNLEPIKVHISKQIIKIAKKHVAAENILITGSFLEKGFHFNDVDIILISDSVIPKKHIEAAIVSELGVIPHILSLSNKELLKGLETDPLYHMLLSQCVSLKRFIYKVKSNSNYKLLDLHLLKSKVLIDNFSFLSGREKYELTRNMVALLLFVQKRKVSNEIVNREIVKAFGLTSVRNIKDNMIGKGFLHKYKKVYRKTSNLILKKIKNDSKQKKDY